MPSTASCRSRSGWSASRSGRPRRRSASEHSAAQHGTAGTAAAGPVCKAWSACCARRGFASCRGQPCGHNSRRMQRVRHQPSLRLQPWRAGAPLGCAPPCRKRIEKAKKEAKRREKEAQREEKKRKRKEEKAAKKEKEAAKRAEKERKVRLLALRPAPCCIAASLVRAPSTGCARRTAEGWKAGPQRSALVPARAADPAPPAGRAHTPYIPAPPAGGAEAV